MSPNKYIVNGERVTADQYNKEKYEDLRVRVPKGKKEILQAYVKEHGKSLNGFINEAIDEKMQRDGAD